MNLRTQFEKFYNRQYFAAEYIVEILTLVINYIKDLIAKTIDYFFPKAHAYETLIRRRNTPWALGLQDLIRGPFISILRGVVWSCIGSMIILPIIHFILCFVGHCIGDTSFVVHGVGIGLFASFFIGFLIDYIFSIRHKKYEKYRKEYLMEKTSKKIMWMLCIFILMLLNCIICGIMFAGAYSDKVADYIVSLIK